MFEPTEMRLYVLGRSLSVEDGEVVQAFHLDRLAGAGVVRLTDGGYLLVRHHEGSCRAIESREVSGVFRIDSESLFPGFTGAATVSAG